MSAPIAVNHGKQFGHDNWYTFCCPSCKQPICSGQEQCKCGQKIEWIKPKKAEGEPQ